MLAFNYAGRVRLVSRHGVEHTARFPQLSASLAQLPARTLVVSPFHLLGDEHHGELATPPALTRCGTLACAEPATADPAHAPLARPAASQSL